MARNYVRENVPLSRFGVLVAQLESIVASSSQQSPDPLLCFDLLSDLISSIDEEPKESILLWQRKCEDALYSLLILGARRPVRHLASVAMARIIYKGDSISIYSRVSTLQGFLSDGKRSEPHKVAGAAQCLGELYRHFGRRVTSGLTETTMIATKLMKFHEEFVRQEALLLLQNALEGCGGGGGASAYSEAFRLITRVAIGDKSFVVRIAAARCLKAFAHIGGPGLGVGELDNLASHCVKALEDPMSSVRDAFAEALGLLLALGMNPQAQVQPKGKGPSTPARKLEGGLQRHLDLPFTKANGHRSKDVRIGVTLSWVYFLQAICLRYKHPDSELQDYALQVMEMLRFDGSVDAHALACVLYILRVGVTDQMTEPTQRSFLVFLGKQFQSPDVSAAMKIAVLRILSYTLKTLGEVPSEFKEVFDNTMVAAVSHSSQLVRVEAAITVRTLAEVDPTCVGGLISYVVTTLNALRDNVSYEKGSNLKVELDLLHGQATVLAALVSISPKLPLGYPARLPKLVLDVSKKMLMEASKNVVAETVEKEVGWLLLSSLLASMPKEELEDQVFDILSLWATLFSGNVEHLIKQKGDLTSEVCVLSAAVDALTSFVRCFISPGAGNNGVLLQPVMVYLSRALSYISVIAAKEMPNIKPALNIFIIRTLTAYQSLPDPMAYKRDHPQLIQLCTIPYRDGSGCEESSCLRLLLDKRDAWLGPWIPGRDWFEDELRAFQGGKDGLMPCVWENDVSSFPQPETINKTLMNQMLLCFGIMFASQDSSGMLSLLGMIEQCLKTGKKQSWHAASVTNICVGLLAGLKALVTLRPQPLGPEITNLAQAIFQSILAEGDICASQRRASSEGLGLLARLGNDISTARMTRGLLGDLTGVTDSNYAGSLALALGCIHRCAGGMALSSLVPSTVSSISLLAKSSIPGLQIWSLHGLLLTIEAAGLSFVSQVQATLALAMDILLSEENGRVDLQQGVGRLINAIVEVLGPELAPGSIFFSRCKSVVAEISSWQETATLLECVRFTQQLVLFAPRAVSLHSHVQTLLSTLSSRQPTLRHLAVTTLRHLIEKDPVSVIEERIEDNLFHTLDEETDSEIGSLIRSTIMRLLYASCPTCPSRWILICRNMVLSTSSRGNAESNNSDSDPPNSAEGDASLTFGDDGETMVASSNTIPIQGYDFEASTVKSNRDKHLRCRTRVFAAECLSHLPTAVGSNPAHFDLSLARKRPDHEQAPCDWLVVHLQELISLAYQISTIQFENMRPLGVGLLCTTVDKFEKVSDPELPGHLLLEQFQAQLVSAVRTALDASSGPILLEAGLQLATKIMTSGIISGDQAAVKRIFSLISRPLNDFKDLYYPSFAEWVTCKIKVRLLAAHASLKCYTYAFLRRHHGGIPDEFVALLPLFSKSSSSLGRYWIQVLKDYSHTFLGSNIKRNWNPFLDGIQSPLVSSKLLACLEEAWPVILQAAALDAVPINSDGKGYSRASVENNSEDSLISGYSMVELEREEYQFLWGFSTLVLFQGLQVTNDKKMIMLGTAKVKFGVDSSVKVMNPIGLKLHEIVLPVFQFLSTHSFFADGFLTLNICLELLQIFTYSVCTDDSWNSLAISVLSQIVQNCPEDFLETENFVILGTELCLAYLFKCLQSADLNLPDHSDKEDLISPLLITAKTLMGYFKPKTQKRCMSVTLAYLLIGFKCLRRSSTELVLSKVIDFVKFGIALLKKIVEDVATLDDDGVIYLRTIFGTCLNAIAELTKDFIMGIHQLESNRTNVSKLIQLKLAFCVEQNVSLAKLAFEMEFRGSHKESSSIGFAFFKFCTENIHSVLTDSNVQVQAIGLQVLKSMTQRYTKEDNSLTIFFFGVLVGDFLTIIQKILQKPITKESVAIAGECLRILMFLQTVSKSRECQGGFMNLLLEAIIMVFSASEDGSSKEANDIRSTAVRLVSHLAQIPSSAVHLKDVLLSMPVVHRQRFQGMVRASVNLDNNAPQMKPTAPLLEIKLPGPAGGMPERDSLPSATSIYLKEPSEETDLHDSIGGSEEDEDDWDTFQSFPASAIAVGTDSKEVIIAEEPDLPKNSSALECGDEKDDSQEFTSSRLNSMEGKNAEHPESGEQDLISDIPGDRNEAKEVKDFHSNIGVTNPSDGNYQEVEEELIPSLERSDRTATKHDNEIAPRVEHHNENFEGLVVKNSEGLEQLESMGNKIEAVETDHQQVEGLVQKNSEGLEQMESLDNRIEAPATDHERVKGEERSTEVNIAQKHEVEADRQTDKQQQKIDIEDTEKETATENKKNELLLENSDNTELAKSQGISQPTDEKDTI